MARSTLQVFISFMQKILQRDLHKHHRTHKKPTKYLNSIDIFVQSYSQN